MEVIDGIAVMRRISELNELAVQEYVDQLKRSNPLITEDEIKAEVQKWWLDKEEYWPEEFFRPGNPERFQSVEARENESSESHATDHPTER